MRPDNPPTPALAAQGTPTPAAALAGSLTALVERRSLGPPGRLARGGERDRDRQLQSVTAFVSSETVKTHFAHVFKKVDVHSRVELVARSLRRAATD